MDKNYIGETVKRLMVIMTNRSYQSVYLQYIIYLLPTNFVLLLKQCLILELGLV